MTDHTLAVLVRRRAEMAGEMRTLQQTKLYELHADLAALDAVIRQFDPEYKIGAIRPVYRRQSSGEHGALSRAVLDTLRQAEAPMSAAALAERIMADRALDRSDRALVRSTRKRVDMALRYQRTNGMVREGEQTGAEVVWEIAG